ncbi:MAG: DNA-3-methyladenine glycosylase 2 family protein [Bacteroidota bacterium]
MLTQQIKSHLQKDPILRPLVEQLEVPERPDFGGDVYFGLLRSIAYQQLSGKAAGTIFGRFLDLFPGGYPEADRLLEFSVSDLRTVGMSRSKSAYLHNVALFWKENRLATTDWAKYSDQEVLDLLTQIKGVGNWTVEMVLMFILKRPDLLPIDDLVVRNQMVKLYGLEELKGKALKQALLEKAEPWRPYRSWASRYLWASKGVEL